MRAKRRERFSAERRGELDALLLGLGQRPAAPASASRHVKYAPLSPIALWNSPRASGDAISALTANEPGRLAEDRDVAGIAAERRDVVLDPPQRRDLIEHAVVARRVAAGLARQLGMREEPEHAEPVVERDEHHALARERLAVVARLGAGAGLKAAAVNPHHHRQPIAGGLAGVQMLRVEAVLALFA